MSMSSCRSRPGRAPVRLPAVSAGGAVARIAAAAVTLSMLVGGCTVGPDYSRPSVPAVTAYREIKGWKAASPRSAARGPWWSVFRDPELDRLVGLVNADNQTLAASAAAYEQALALVREARAGLYPTVSASVPVARSGGAGGRSVSEVGGVLTASWALDLWGRARRSVEAEEATARQRADDLADTRLLLQAAVALAYVQLRAAEAQTGVMERTVAEYRKSLAIIEDQYAAGAARKYDVINQRTQLLDAQAALIGFRGTRAIAQHALALLTGRAPAELVVGPGRLPKRIVTPPIGLPSELLEHRPDIAAAEEGMRRANAEIGLAMAGYYPTVTLGGSAGATGGSIDALDPVWSIGLSLVGTLLDAGRTKAEVDAAKAAYVGAVATYRGTILAAFKEVEDQLSTIRILEQQGALYTEQTGLARQALTIAFDEYRAGAQTFDTVIRAEQDVLAAELASTRARADLYEATINLIVALGGGWTEEKKPVDAADRTNGPTAPHTGT